MNRVALLGVVLTFSSLATASEKSRNPAAVVARASTSCETTVLAKAVELQEVQGWDGNIADIKTLRSSVSVTVFSRDWTHYVNYPVIFSDAGTNSCTVKGKPSIQTFAD